MLLVFIYLDIFYYCYEFFNLNRTPYHFLYMYLLIKLTRQRCAAVQAHVIAITCA